MKKYAQQLIVTILLIGAAAGVAFAGPSFDITTLIAGFIRYTNNHEPTANCSFSGPGDYCYGYGWSGNLQDWGYGYGYKSKDFSDELDTTLAAEYGFDGDDGSVTIESVDTTQTTAIIAYSTNYLSRIQAGYGVTDPIELDNLIGNLFDAEFNSGERTWEIEGLTCDTVYYYSIAAFDVADNPWPMYSSFTTSACDTPDVPDSNNGPRVTGGSVAGAGTKAGDSSSSLLRLPPITLALGSIGVDVQDLQILLNHIGVFLDNHGAGSPGEETQYFGQKTYAAVRAFQQVFDLEKVDGIYGPETRGAMEEQLKM